MNKQNFFNMDSPLDSALVVIASILGPFSPGRVSRGALLGDPRNVDVLAAGHSAVLCGRVTVALPPATQTAINQLKQLAITTGATATTFAPDRSVRRDEMASFLSRTLDLVAPTP